MYFVPRTDALRRVVIHDTDRLRVLRTELELLKRVHRLARKSGRGHFGVLDAAQQFTPEDQAELSDILRTARRPIVREMIAVIDDEFPELRKEIMMSVVNEEAEKIAQDAQDAGVTGESSADQAATPETEEVQPTPTLEDIDATLAAAQSQLASLVEDTSARETEATPAESTEVDPAPVAEVPSEDAPADAPQIETVAAGAAETATRAAAEVDTFADGEAPGANDAEPSAPIASPVTDETAEESVETSVDENPEVVTATDEKPEPAAAASETATDADDSATDEAVEATAPTPCAPNEPSTDAPCAEPPQPAAEVVAGNDDAEPSFEVQGVSMDEPACPDSASTQARPAVVAEDTAATDTVGATATTESVEVLDPDHSPERVERTVAEIEQGIRKLAGVLSGEVTDQWNRAREALAEVAESREAIAQAGRDAEPILAEMKRLVEEAKQTQETLKLAAQEAKTFREESRRAKERAETSAAAAELAAEQVVREVENARAASRG